MATDYSKKTVAELQELLKSRSLPHTGKKADLIARLQQNDTEGASAAPATESKADNEDEITDDWTADADAATTDARAAAMAAGGKGQPANPPAVPNQAVDTDPSKTADLKVASPTKEKKKADGADGEKEEKEVEKVDFTSGIKETSIDEELAKREKRAARFGTTATTDEEANKAIERAKKFGTEPKVVKGLDQALPERSRKRGRGEGDGRRENGGRGKRTQLDPKAERARKDPGWMTNKDKEAAEKRKRRFAAA